MRRGFRQTCSSFTTQFSVLRYDRVGIKNLTFFFYYDFHSANLELSSAVPSYVSFLVFRSFYSSNFRKIHKKGFISNKSLYYTLRTIADVTLTREQVLDVIRDRANYTQKNKLTHFNQSLA